MTGDIVVIHIENRTEIVFSPTKRKIATRGRPFLIWCFYFEISFYIDCPRPLRHDLEKRCFRGHFLALRPSYIIYSLNLKPLLVLLQPLPHSAVCIHSKLMLVLLCKRHNGPRRKGLIEDDKFLLIFYSNQ